MNIVQVPHIYRPSIGGIENYCHRLVNSLSESRHSVSTITTDMSLQNKDSPLQTGSNVTYCPTKATVLRNPLSPELYRRVRETDAALYHLHSPWYLSTLSSTVALSAETPTVMTLHGFQPIQSRTAKLLDRAYRPIAQYILDNLDRTIVLGESEKRQLMRRFDVPENRIAVIPNGIHPEEHDVSLSEIQRINAQYGLDPETPTVLYVSRLVPLKNPDLLVEAVTDALPDRSMDVVLVGNGQPEYVSKLERNADDRVQFLANLPFEDLQALYHAADVFTMASESEGLPTVILEAMNARLPIITTPVGALSDVITHREHGWVLDVPPDAARLAEAIEYYLDHPNERAETGRRNREYVRAEFDWEDIADDIEREYLDVLAE